MSLKPIKSMRKRIKKIIPKRMLKRCIKIEWKINCLKRARQFKGAGVYCPCCGKSFAKFAEVKVDGRYYNEEMFPENLSAAMCPHCESMPRHRILCDYFEKNKGGLFVGDPKILIFAPARALQVWFGKNKIKFISADLFDPLADINIDIQDVPFEDNEFDFISCDHVLEHVPDYPLAVSELFRIVKKGGIAEITVPLLAEMEKTYEDEKITSFYERAKAFGQYDHLRIFGKDFESRIKEAGFELSLHDGDECDEKIMPLKAPALFDYNKIFICRKPKA